MNLKDKVVFVTGSSSGIGKETALLLARKGANVVVSYYKDKEEGQKVLKECKGASKCTLVKLDISNIESIKSALKKVIICFGRIDILINNAGIFIDKTFLDSSIKDIEDQINVNLVGTMKMTYLTLPFLQKQREAIIINVSSIAGRQMYDGIVVPYAASKFGLAGFTKSLALELPKSIRIYSVNPGLTATPMSNFQGVSAIKIAEIIVKTAEENLGKKSGEDIDCW